MVSGNKSVIFHFSFKHNCKKSLWKNIILVILHSCTPSLLCAPPQLPLFPSPPTYRVDDFQRLRFGNSQSPDKFTGNPKTQINIYIYIYIAHHLLIFEVNGTAQYLPRQQKHPYMAIYQRRVSTCHRQQHNPRCIFGARGGQNFETDGQKYIAKNPFSNKW